MTPKEINVFDTKATSPEVHPAFNAWAAQIRAIHADACRPLTDEADGRLRELEEAGYPIRDGVAQFLGTAYFEVCTVASWPDCPIPKPAWSARREVYPAINDWPLIHVADTGDWIEVGPIRARLARVLNVTVDELPDDWDQDPNGETLDGERPAFGVPHDVSLSIDFDNGRETIEFSVESARHLPELLNAIAAEAAK
ncbi:hypothetical protein [Pseudolysinimonas sp.]